MPNRHAAMALVAGLSLAGLAHAQAPAAQAPAARSRLRATIEKVDGDTLQLRERNGQEMAVMLSPDTKVVGVGEAAIGDIKPGSFIGSAAMPQPDGTLKALEVHVFPPSMNGSGEGSYAWDLAPGSTMTNGTVSDLVAVHGRSMTVKYSGGGEKTITVPDDVPIVSMTPTDRAQLTVGAHVVVAPVKGADGMLTASRINVGLNGAVPPM